MDGLYYGVDLGNKFTVVSFYEPKMKEPQTISMVMGSEEYQIPTALSKRNGISQWFYGKEAKRAAQEGGATEAENLLESAEKNTDIWLDGQRYNSRELLAVFLKHLLELNGIPLRKSDVRKLVVSVPNLRMDTVEMMTVVAAKIGISSSQLCLTDHRESFYYYALNQEAQIFLHDVLLFDAFGSKIRSCLLKRDLTKKPQIVTLTEEVHEIDSDEKDLAFRKICENTIQGKIVSAVYLVGDGFDGGWMHSSLKYLLQGRRVFIGKNLYSKGACYAGLIQDGQKEFPFLYVGDHEMKMTISLKVTDRKETRFLPLIRSGNSWFESESECETLLDGSPEIEIYVQRADSHSAHVEMMRFSDLPVREKRSTRLRIKMKAISDQDVQVTVTDIGFGEIAPGSGKTWTHTVHLPKEEIDG